MVVSSAAEGLGRNSEKELVERHRYGDRDAFEEIYRLHEEMVYNLCLRLTGNPGDAEDLVQETFLRVYRYLAGFRGGSSLRTWIYRIALNRARSRFRGLKVLYALADDASKEPVDPRRGPEERAMASDTGRLVEKALSRIPRNFREAVVLRDLEGLAYQEIAEILGVRIGTVRSRIARGRERLRRELEAMS